MRDKTWRTWSLALVAALLCAPAALADDAAAELPAPQQKAAVCEPSSQQAPGGEALGETLDGKLGAADAATCWMEYRSSSQCDCTRVWGTAWRVINEDRTCCTNGWCSSWSGSSSCTNNPC